MTIELPKLCEITTRQQPGRAMRKEAQHEIPCLGVIIRIHTYAVQDWEMIVRRRGLASSRRPTADICLIQNPPQLPPIGDVKASEFCGCLSVPCCICINKQPDVAEHRRRRVALLRAARRHAEDGERREVKEDQPPPPRSPRCCASSSKSKERKHNRRRPRE